MMNMIHAAAMNQMISEDVNVPALRYPLNHMNRKPRNEIRRREARKGWIDGWLASRRNP